MIQLHKSKSLLIALGLGMTASLAQAVTVIAADDSIVKQDAATTNQDGGTFAELWVKNASSNTRKSYMKFDLSGLNADASQSATITLTLTRSQTSDFTFQVFGLNSGFSPAGSVLGTNWAETAITWDNAPGNNTGSKFEFDTADTTQLGTDITVGGSTAVGTTYNFTLPTLSDFLQTDNTVTLMVGVPSQANASDTHGFASSENTTSSYRPSLEFTAVPEPSALALLGLAGFGLMLRRRR